VTAPISSDERITAVITEANRPLAIGELRALCRVRNGTLYERLTALTDAGQIVRGPEGYRLATRL
jgi:DNA-binding IclR family transcriptional regulator